MAPEGTLSPRARAILTAVEREVSSRLQELEEGELRPGAPTRPAPFRRPGPELLAALELGVAGRTREEAARSLGLGEPSAVLDAVFGAGTGPAARLPRTR